MNASKAREFFSSYFDGSLDGGLRQAFERKLNTDSDLKAEYQAFERTMSMLDSMRETEVEVPFDLTERINARIDRHVYEQKRAEKAPALAWWKSLAIGTAAALAIFGTIKGFGGGPSATAEANLLGGPQAEHVQVVRDNGELVLKYQTTGRKSVTIREDVAGKELKRVDLDGKQLESELRNSDAQPRLVSVQVDGESRPTLVAVPGTDSIEVTTGKGTIGELAKNLAGRYRVPVVVVANDVAREMTWTYSSLEPVSGATEALKDASFSVELHSDGILWIQQH